MIDIIAFGGFSPHFTLTSMANTRTHNNHKDIRNIAILTAQIPKSCAKLLFTSLKNDKVCKYVDTVSKSNAEKYKQFSGKKYDQAV